MNKIAFENVMKDLGIYNNVARIMHDGKRYDIHAWNNFIITFDSENNFTILGDIPYSVIKECKKDDYFSYERVKNSLGLKLNDDKDIKKLLNNLIKYENEKENEKIEDIVDTKLSNYIEKYIDRIEKAVESYDGVKIYEKE